MMMTDLSGKFSIDWTEVPFPGIDVTFSARELGIYTNPWLFIPGAFLISLVLNASPLPVPDTLSGYISQELPSSPLDAQDECGSQGLSATINFNIIAAFLGDTPSITCG